MGQGGGNFFFKSSYWVVLKWPQRGGLEGKSLYGHPPLAHV